MTFPAPERRGESERHWTNGRFTVETRRYVDPPTGQRYERNLVMLEGTGAVVVLPLLHTVGSLLEVVFTRQYRHAVEDFVLELPAGRIDAGETPAEAAARELREETGFAAAEMFPLVSRALVSPGWNNEVQYYYAARHLSPDPLGQDPFENVEVERVPLADVPDLVTNGTLTDAKSLGVLAAFWCWYLPSRRLTDEW